MYIFSEIKQPDPLTTGACARGVHGKGGVETGRSLEEKHGGRRKTGRERMGRENRDGKGKSIHRA